MLVVRLVLLLVIYRTTAGFGGTRKQPISSSPINVSVASFKNQPANGGVCGELLISVENQQFATHRPFR